MYRGADLVNEELAAAEDARHHVVVPAQVLHTLGVSVSGTVRVIERYIQI